jgi:hypothetical protein
MNEYGCHEQNSFLHLCNLFYDMFLLSWENENKNFCILWVKGALLNLHMHMSSSVNASTAPKHDIEN